MGRHCEVKGGALGCGWCPAQLGVIAGLIALILIVSALSPLLDRVPLHFMQLAIGLLLLLFGMRWLRKSILPCSGVIPMHDEGRFLRQKGGELREQMHYQGAWLHWLAGLTIFKAVLLESLEGAFIVIAISAGGRLLAPATARALAARLVVAAVGLIVHRRRRQSIRRRRSYVGERYHHAASHSALGEG
jgi:uncharacterized membrane protein